MNKIFIVFSLTFFSCGSSAIVGTYQAVEAPNSLWSSTLALKDDFSYTYEVEADIGPLIFNEGIWRVNGRKIILKPKSIKSQEANEVNLSGLQIHKVDSLHDLSKNALSFYMIVRDTSWIAGAIVKTSFETLQTNTEGQPLLIADTVSRFTFEYLGQVIPIAVPADAHATHFTYFINFSSLTKIAALEKLPFAELTYKKRKLFGGREILFIRVPNR
jgi:hypothetical protein